MVIAYLLVLILVLYSALQVRETFILRVGNPFADQSLVSMEEKNSANEVMSLYPSTCAGRQDGKTNFLGGVCYESCRPSYVDDGLLCRAESVNVGIGEMAPCPEGWNDAGLICTKPLSCETRCVGGRDWFGNCWAWDLRTECSGGTWGRLNGNMPCPSDRDNVDGLCYNKCPADKPHRIPGMPYLCYAGGDLVYAKPSAIPSTMRLGGSRFKFPDTGG